jgi:hypothetical protein
MFLVLLFLITHAQQPTGVAQQVYAVSGTIDRIDRSGRLVTIIGDDGLQTPIYAGPDLPIFDQLARGDRVTIRYYDSYIVTATPTARMVPLENTTVEAQKALDTADANIMQQLRLIVTIDAIDRSKNLVTYHGADNRRVLRAVQHPALLEGLKVGDVVTITYTRARAASIEKRQEDEISDGSATSPHAREPASQGRCAARSIPPAWPDASDSPRRTRAGDLRCARAR